MGRGVAATWIVCACTAVLSEKEIHSTYRIHIKVLGGYLVCHNELLPMARDSECELKKTDIDHIFKAGETA
jgi:hypothetical protein